MSLLSGLIIGAFGYIAYKNAKFMENYNATEYLSEFSQSKTQNEMILFLSVHGLT